MFSFKSFKNFFIFNSVLSSFSFLNYFLTFNHHYDFLYVLCANLIRNYGIIDLIEYSTKNKPFILDDKKRFIPYPSYPNEFDLYLISTTAIESITFIIIKYLFYHDDTNIDLFYDFLTFIPVSFLYEIIFDFFHFSSHLLMHKNKWLYKNFHKTHHKFIYPSSITTFYQHPIDVFISNSLPSIITLCIMPVKPSFFQFILISTYKVFIEISGHLGKKINSTSFTQCMWIPKMLSIELKVEHHDLHHTLNNCNYGKRFSLWDKIFGTFKDENKDD